MKTKHFIGITMILLVLMGGWGFSKKQSFQDLNDIAEPLSYFKVALLEDSIVEAQLGKMESDLSKDSNIIIAVECISDMKFKFHCTTQDVVVKKVFKGDLPNEGDIIEIVKGGSEIYLTSLESKRKPELNMGFVNAMKKGSHYLIFLDKKVDNTDNLYITSDYIIAPIFGYEKTTNISNVLTDEPQSTVDYTEVQNSEFFFRSETAYEKMNMLKTKLIDLYKYK